MLSSTRSAAPRALRLKLVPRRSVRLQSTSTSAGGGKASTHFASGVAGGLAGAALFYGIYSFTPSGRVASTINKTAIEANKQYKVAADKLQKSTPNPDQAIEYIKQFAYTYVGWIPGGRAYVDAAFKDVELVREKHKDDVDNIISDGYKQFQELSKTGLSAETASKAYDALTDLSKKIANLSTDAIGDIIDNHPQLKEKLGGNIDKLKSMGDQYGPEAKKQVEETWGQVKDIFAGGFSVASFNKAKQIIDEKVKQVQKLGDDAWKKSLEAAQPFLDKNPKVKELIEKNVDALKGGNVKELFDKARSAVESGDIGGLEEYVKSATDKAKSKTSELAGSFNLEKYTKMLPENGGQILSTLQQLSQVAEKHQEEGQALLKETYEELREVLEKKSQKAKDIVESAKKEAK